MQSKLLNLLARRIAGPLLSLTLAGPTLLQAETPGARFSAPKLGWVLSPDGAQLIEITGVLDSPRQGAALALPAAATRLWPSPDASAAVLRTASGYFLAGSPDLPVALAELPAGSELSVAWDRASNGFAACWSAHCESRDQRGAIVAQWEVAEGSRVLAYSSRAGLVTAVGDSATWRTGDWDSPLAMAPVAAAFRNGTNELWLIDAEGRLSGLDAQGRPVEGSTLVAGAVGLVGSLDGQSFLAASAEGLAASYNLSSGHREQWALEDTVEGLWPAPGLFAVRLHESAKRAVAIWNGETGVTGWTPSAAPAPAASEVRQ